MKKKFTFLIAALMLLTMVTHPKTGFGQGTPVSQTGFSGVSGYLNNDNKVTYSSYKGSAGTSPGIYGGDCIRLYQASSSSNTGGYIVIGVSNGYKITSASITSGSTYNSTTTGYKLVDSNPGTTPAKTSFNVSNYTLNKNSTYTISSISTQYIIFACFGTTSSTRLDISSISITYQADGPYTVTLGDDNTTLPEASAGAGVTLPSRNDVSPYIFAGWSETNLTVETTTATVIPAGLYHPTANVTLYPVYSRSETGATTWTLVDNFNNVSEGVYAILSNEKKAFIGTMASGNGESTSTSFVFGSDNLATTVPDGICEITMNSYDGGYSMYNETYGYLYVDGTSAGHLIWSQEPAKWVVNYSTNWVCSYNSTTVFLRSYTNSSTNVTTFRPYSNSTQSRIYFAKKGVVTTTYYISVVSSTFTVTYNANSGTGNDFIDDNGGAGYGNGETVTVLANEGNSNPNFTKTGHEFFCWSDMQDGGAAGATLYDPDDDFTISANTTLYAQWITVNYNVTMASDGTSADFYATYGNNGILTEGTTETIAFGTELTLTADNVPSGYSVNWLITNSLNEDVTTQVLNNGIVTVPAYGITISGSVEPVYIVIFDSNGVENMVSQTNNPVFSLATPTNVPTGFTFVGWTMYDSDINVNSILEGSTINLTDYNTDNASLYAVFSGEVGAFPAIPGTLGSFEKVTENLQDWTGSYLIVHEGNTTNSQPKAFNGSLNDLDVSLNTKDVTISNGTITATEALVAAMFTIASDSEVENYPYSIKSASGYYIGHTGSGNGFSSSQTDKYGHSIDYDNGKIVITASGGSRLQYLQSGNQSRFKYYSTNQKDIQLYKYIEGTPGVPAIGGTTQRFIRVFQNETAEDYVFILGPSIIPSGYYLDMGNNEIYSDEADLFIIEDGGQLISNYAVAATVKKNIRAYNSNDDGWNLIASPIAGNDQAISGLIPSENTTTTYDLYFLDEEETMWRNYKQNSGFGIDYKKGYLYAHSENTIINFAGTLASGTSANVTLTKVGDGWNLIGNPLPFKANVGKKYYVINGRTVTVSDGGTVPPCSGIIVKATEASETVTFSKPSTVGSTNNHSNVQMVLTQTVTTRGESSNQTLDNAIVSFNEGSQLEKFYFGTQDANIYIPQGNEEYAIVSAGAQGEMPVNFKAAVDGTYTINVEADDVVMNYLHLIDNLTGADVDLLANPSYTFNARNDDYASRFKLVFSANGVNENETENDNFAFISNGQIILTEQGDVQVYDVMGRMISSHNNVSHITTEGMAAGVYVIRLTNGSETMTQKLVVK